MKPQFHVLAALFACAALAQPASAGIAGFQGPLDPGNLVIGKTGTYQGNLTTPDGVSYSATSLTIRGSDTDDPSLGCVGASSALPGPCQIVAVFQNLHGTIDFDWNYLSTDFGGGIDGDPFGFIADGVVTILTAGLGAGGSLSASGSRSVSFNNSFGWFINCTDCIGGNAVATVSNVTFAPTPASLPLTAAALGAMLWAGARRARRDRR